MVKRKQASEKGLPSLSLVFGYIAVKDLQRIQDRVGVLSRLGYGNSEMAIICDRSEASIRAVRSQLDKLRRRA
jgi:hypothetical protein